VILSVSTFAAKADTVELVMMPGKVIEGHAKYEAECEKCHVKFDQDGQKLTCLTCHTDQAKDVREHKRFHGRTQDKDCHECHTDHKGREAKIAVVDKIAFDHGETGFALRDKHQATKCDRCHKASAKYRLAPADCSSCHKTDDDKNGHRGELGPDCAKCHSEKSWKDAKFDHDQTRFPISAGKHKDVKCKECHIDRHYKKTPKECNACHKKIDQEKGHKGLYGVKCATCHVDKSWKEIHFNHDKSTKYHLKGKHKDTKCDQCHPANRPLYKQNLSSKCIACHKKDDKEKGHQGSLGDKCESCHNEKTWKGAPFDHNKSHFPLTGAHIKVLCKKCHLTATFKGAQKDCYFCHAKDDNKVHVKTLGSKCEPCHNTRSWQSWDFNHNKTSFKLAGKHANLKCKECHMTPMKRNDGKLMPSRTCGSCHMREDVHNGGFGSSCDRCHVGTDWRTLRVGIGRR
jgi:hypothetical protein